MLFTIGIAITFFLSFLLLTKKHKILADKILAAWLLLVGLHLTLFSLYASGDYSRYPELLGIEIPMPLLHGPFLFLYTSALTGTPLRFRKSLIHFIPFFLALVALTPFFLLTPEEKIVVYQEEGKAYAVLMRIIFTGILVSGIGYSLASFMAVRRHRRRILEEFAYTEKINLQWLTYLTIGLAVIWVLVMFTGDHIVFSAVVLYVLFIGYYGIKQVGIFTNPPPASSGEKSEPSEPDLTENAKYQKTALTDEQLRLVHSDLLHVMKEKKMYQRGELTLSDVARELDVHPNTLSQVINRAEEKNFFDYINDLRVEAFKKMAVHPEYQQFTLLALAHECGFNSKTSFNRNFKKAEGMSPTEFLKAAHVSLK